MKQTFAGRALRIVAGAAVAAMLAACSGAGSVPSVGGPNLANQVRQALPDFSGESGTLTSPSRESAEVAPDANPCKNPQFPLICVKAGHSGTLSIKVTCTKNSKPIKCGSVKWSTKTSNKGLTASFKPNPGNPTTETVKASKTIKVGHYSQSITAKCSKVKNCPTNYAAPIYVTN